eukprot:CAMPEP_0204903478 /NCGR_PEP_ID=MMETSP1397-20131031/4283_1 /ASSEMBLY_ACC=CAM_ASM_000891 /TAXON_ID=49980 /ORGANISM="Climacostomum Climacostomum virens, Strain Stock W-24" /LENGTH=312 /DNA_ID=CAMNT_0052072123 /DNA_START=676 /DNA_END=1614 /DNA_ORIENTATION=-
MNQPVRKIVFHKGIAIELSSSSFKTQRPFGELTATTRLFSVNSESSLENIIPKKRQRSEVFAEPKEVVVEQVQLQTLQVDNAINKKLQELEEQLLNFNASLEPEHGSRTMPYNDCMDEEVEEEEEDLDVKKFDQSPPEKPVSQPSQPLFSEVERETVKRMLEEMNRACHLTAEQISIVRRYGYNITRDPWGLHMGGNQRRGGRFFRPRGNRRPMPRPEYQAFDFNVPNSASFLAENTPKPQTSSQPLQSYQPLQSANSLQPLQQVQVKVKEEPKEVPFAEQPAVDEVPEVFNVPYLLVPQRVLMSMRPDKRN